MVAAFPLTHLLPQFLHGLPFEFILPARALVIGVKPFFPQCGQVYMLIIFLPFHYFRHQEFLKVKAPEVL